MGKHDLWTQEEVAGYLRIHVRTVMRWRKAEYLKAIVLPGGEVRIHVDEIKKLLERRNTHG